MNLRINSVVSYYCLNLLVLTVATVFAYFYFPYWFSLSPELHRSAKIMVLLVEISQVLCLPLRAYFAVLSDLQRYELSTGLDFVGELFHITTVLTLISSFSIHRGMIFLAGLSASIFIIYEYQKHVGLQ